MVFFMGGLKSTESTMSLVVTAGVTPINKFGDHPESTSTSGGALVGECQGYAAKKNDEE